MQEDDLTIEEQLEHLILGSYKSVMAFAKEANVPYTTIKSILERGVSKAGIETSMKICSKLGISIDGLADGEIIFKTNLGMKLSVEESELLKKFRELDKAAQRRILRAVQGEYDDAVASSVEDTSTGGGTG